MNFANLNRHEGDEKDERTGANRKRLWTPSDYATRRYVTRAPVCASNWSRSDQWRKLVVWSTKPKMHYLLKASEAVCNERNHQIKQRFALARHFQCKQIHTRREREREKEPYMHKIHVVCAYLFFIWNAVAVGLDSHFTATICSCVQSAMRSDLTWPETKMHIKRDTVRSCSMLENRNVANRYNPIRRQFHTKPPHLSRFRFATHKWIKVNV